MAIFEAEVAREAAASFVDAAHDHPHPLEQYSVGFGAEDGPLMAVKLHDRVHGVGC